MRSAVCGLPDADSPGVADPAPDRSPPGAEGASRRLISASAIMVAGTLVSRVVGFGRFVLLAYLFGIGTRQADMFAVANTVPVSMYVLLAGGVLTTVLVPQIVRAVHDDRDGGAAYTNRIFTGGLIGLFVITLALTLAVPLIIDLYTAAGWRQPQLAEQYASMTALGYYCMPQVFFYGVFVLVGQVLNARDRFGPMMWAPIANNVVSIAVLLLFWLVFGQTDAGAPFTMGEELVLGLGSTLGIAVQAAVLVPYLRATGFRFQPRFDFRGTGLGRTVRLAKWALGFVLVNQVGLVVINKVASAATVGGSGGGVAAYNYAYALWIIPHSLITVSLATAMLPSASRLMLAGDLGGTAAEVTRTLRLALTALLPASVGLVIFGVPIARLVFGFGTGQRDADYAGWALVVLALGLVPFTCQFVYQRAFYAMENTKTPFFLQVLITVLTVVLGVTLATIVDIDALIAACLAGGYTLAYVVGLVFSARRLRRDLPALAARPLARLSGRLILAIGPGAVVLGALVWWIESSQPGQLVRAASLSIAGVAVIGAFLVLARALRIVEVTEILTTLRRRGPVR
jgi:putative peptidoglycan lipid II flippase